MCGGILNERGHGAEAVLAVAEVMARAQGALGAATAWARLGAAAAGQRTGIGRCGRRNSSQLGGARHGFGEEHGIKSGKSRRGEWGGKRETKVRREGDGSSARLGTAPPQGASGEG